MTNETTASERERFEALETALIAECERAMRQRDEFLRTGVSTAAHGGSHDTCFGHILRAALPAPADQPSHASADSGQGQAADGETLWLWKNGDHFLAFRHLYPCFTPNGDPMTLGEPVGRAVFRHSHNREGRDEHANYLHAGNAAQGNQLWPAGRPLGGGAADEAAGAVAAQAAQVRMDGVHGALGRASLGRSIDPAASAFDVEAFLREWCDYWRLRALDYEDAYKNLRDYAEKNGLDTATHGPRRKDHP